jgi:radical SAM protein with 4Fe4S-binding SPASM domain
VLEELKTRVRYPYPFQRDPRRDIAKALAELGVGRTDNRGPEDIHDAIRGAAASHRHSKAFEISSMQARTDLEYHPFRHERSIFHGGDRSGIFTIMQRLGFSRLVPSGGGKVLNRMLDKEVLEDLYNKIFSLNTGGLQIVTGDPVASQLRAPSGGDADSALPSGGCAAGVSGLTILPDGTVTPCRRLPLPIGNVRKDSLREIWASSETLNALRDKSRYEGKCGECKKWSVCRGCRAIAFAFSEVNGKASYLAEDPQCFLAN